MTSTCICRMHLDDSGVAQGGGSKDFEHSEGWCEWAFKLLSRYLMILEYKYKYAPTSMYKLWWIMPLLLWLAFVHISYFALYGTYSPSKAGWYMVEWRTTTFLLACLFDMLGSACQHAAFWHTEASILNPHWFADIAVVDWIVVGSTKETPGYFADYGGSFQVSEAECLDQWVMHFTQVRSFHFVVAEDPSDPLNLVLKQGLLEKARQRSMWLVVSSCCT